MAVTIHEIENHHVKTRKSRQYTVNIDNRYNISTTVTSHPGCARDWLHYTLHLNRNHRHNLIVGLGVQWNPDYTSFTNSPAATIQLYINNRCLIFHLYHSVSCPRILRRVLSDFRNTFVGIWCHSDAKKLLKSRHSLGMVPGMPIDMRHHVFDRDGNYLRGESIARIADELLGVKIDWKSEICMSNWENDELSEDQIRQASVDAFVSFAVGLRCRAWTLNTYL